MKRLGDYIRPVDVRNRDLKVTKLLGVSISKEFMPSIANIIGTDMSNYKIVTPGQFVYIADTSRRGDKIAIALLSRKEASSLVSAIYTVFEVINENELDPEYLMMWFRRPEFDRYARFHSHGSAREVFGWDEMCEVRLPIPPIGHQREAVAEYSAIGNRIAQNKRLIATLEETARAIYRRTFVEGIDPNNLPAAWRMGTLGEVCSVITKGTTPSTESAKFSQNGVNFIKCESITDDHDIDKNSVSFINEKTHQQQARSIIKKHDIVFTIAGTLGKYAWVDASILPANTNQAVAIIRANEEKISPYFLIGLFMSGLHIEYCKKNVQQAVQANLNLGTLSAMPILLANNLVSKKYANKIKVIQDMIVLKHREQEKIKEMQKLLLSKMGV